MTDRVQDFPAMLRAALGERIAEDATSFVEMLAEDAVMEFPFAPPGLPTRLEGRDTIARYLETLAGLIAFDAIGPGRIVASTEDTAVLAFEASGQGLKTGASYEQRYLSVITTRSDLIVHYQDYWNPLPVVRALAGDAVVEALDLSGIFDA